MTIEKIINVTYASAYPIILGKQDSTLHPEYWRRKENKRK